jgi:hypothetical protein
LNKYGTTQFEGGSFEVEILIAYAKFRIQELEWELEQAKVDELNPPEKTLTPFSWGLISAVLTAIVTTVIWWTAR